MIENPPEISGISFDSLLSESQGARVWLAHQVELDRQVAVKLLVAGSQDAIVSFDQERIALGRLSQHPSIVTVYGSGIIEGHPYLVLEFADSGTLADRIRPGRPDRQELYTLATTIVTALERIHSMSMVHGDVKPSNVLIDSLAGPLLADLGLARFRNAGGSAGYTPAYAAPELLRGQSSTAESDMYSFGVVLYEMLAGRLPVEPRQQQTLAGFARRVSRESPRKLQPDVAPPHLWELVQRLLAKQPDARPSASEVLDVLRHQPETVVVSPIDPPKRKRVGIPLAVLGVGVMVLLLAALALVRNTEVQGDDGPTVSSSTTATIDPTEATNEADSVLDATTTVPPTSATSAPQEPPAEPRRPEVWDWSSATAADPLLWAATTEVDDVAMTIMNLRGLTPMSPTLSGADVWVSAADDSVTDGALFTLDEDGGVSVERPIIPTDQAIVSGVTALVPSVDKDTRTAVLVSYSDDPTAIMKLDLGFREPPARSVTYLSPDLDEWPIAVIAYSLPADEGFGIDSGIRIVAEYVFPDGVGESEYGRPGPILAIAGSSGDYAYIAERSSSPFEGAEVSRWPKLNPGPPVPLPIDSNVSGALQDVIHLAPDGTLWFVSRERIVTRFDLAQDRITGAVRAGPCPVVDELVGCKFLSDDASYGTIAHGAFWIGNAVDGSIYRIDLDSVEVTDIIDIGGTPATPVATGSALWVADLESATMSRIDPESMVVTQRVDLPCFDTGAAPDGMDSNAPALAACEPWLAGLDWVYRPVATDEYVWVPWDGLLFKIRDPSPDTLDGDG